MTPHNCNFNLNNSSRLLGGASRNAGNSRNADGGLPTCGKPWYPPSMGTTGVDGAAGVVAAAAGLSSILCLIFSLVLLVIDNDSRLFFLCDLEEAVSGVVLLDSVDAVEDVEAAAGAGASLLFS